MALINCHECGKPVSTESKKCPACGAAVRLPKKPTSKIALVVAVFIGFGVVVATLNRTTDTSTPSKAAVVLTPAQVAQEKAKKDTSSLTLGLALAGAKTLKRSSKDPQTFEFTEIVTHPNSTVCFEYRAKNSFNAMLQGNAVLANGKLLVRESAGNAFVAAWNKNCTPADGEDVMTLVTRAMEL
jgi:hypothetical protein